MNGNKTRQDILDQINSSINNLSHFNEQFAQYKTQNFQGMDDIATSKETLFKLFNRIKENFTGIPTTGSKTRVMKHQPKSKSGYYSGSSYEPSKESSIDDKETKRVSTKKSSGKFSDKQIRKDGKNSQNQFTK